MNAEEGTYMVVTKWPRNAAPRVSSRAIVTPAGIAVAMGREGGESACALRELTGSGGGG